jgi:hypothetical protein
LERRRAMERMIGWGRASAWRGRSIASPALTTGLEKAMARERCEEKERVRHQL